MALKPIDWSLYCMVSRSSLVHLRLPFSFLLLPVYMLALLSTGSVDWVKALIVFFVLHFLLYTASNAFNSCYDRDDRSIGALKHPPAVTPDLVWLALALDVAAVLVALLAGWVFALGCLVYGLASKAYSWDRTRLKRYPVLGWLMTGLGQGTLTGLLVVVSVSSDPALELGRPLVWLSAALTGMLLLAVFPITQVYQHAEDSRRGDCSMSLLLGVRGTFLLAASLMAPAVGGYAALYAWHSQPVTTLLFLSLVAPATGYFAHWLRAAFKDPRTADYDHTMRMCVLASAGLSLFAATALLLGL